MTPMNVTTASVMIAFIVSRTPLPLCKGAATDSIKLQQLLQQLFANGLYFFRQHAPAIGVAATIGGAEMATLFPAWPFLLKRPDARACNLLVGNLTCKHFVNRR